MSSNATAAGTSASPIIPVAIGIARSASHSPARSGSLTARRTPRHPVFPCCLHGAGGDRGHRLPEQARRLRYLVPRRGREFSAPSLLTGPSGCRDRLPTCCILGPEPARSSAPACLVPGGGISPDGQRWIACRPGFFLPVKVLSRLFRGLFLHYLDKAFAAGRLELFLHPAAPAGTLPGLAASGPRADGGMGGLRQAAVCRSSPSLSYVGRYTHRIAISNSRLLAIDDGKVRFRWKDYRRDNRHRR